MTASEDRGERPLLDQALDLFVYAPVGLLVSSLEDLRPDDLDELAATGRGRVSRLLGNARVVGHLTISMGRRAIETELGRWMPPATAEEEPPPARPVNSRPALEAPAVADPAPSLLRRSDAGPELAIPEYEALSASQVVRRLDGLRPAELEAVYAYESSTKRRRTILHRTQQLLGREETPGQSGRTA